ncbi:hypothetical protein GWJ09_16215 [Proteus sp. G2638]|uniref:hypothetical protein n=1 Tax=unclassified Proteus (in: enterobacteria) TaxID=257482 RepID=UPI001378F86B|nr:MULTISPECIES: hypothetical protein [unclassified Proteus (in: enterobacteria)]HAU5529995.1 hypothetical protein [Proteus mirabilis]NBN40619.1 hypothetical protein [Proteus sp. G2638]NBN57904.1 hypothetical protein [Proteus sp. G3927]HAU5551932.1 hypothetical protein [Proteus mirabilis]HAU5567837.1 hypothetical protein [Proteus mirabilis]
MKLKKVNGVKLLLGVAAIAMSSQAALAAGIASDIFTGTANATYALGQGPQLTITPVNNLRAGEWTTPDTPIASFSVSNLDGHDHYAIRWTPGTFTSAGADVSKNAAILSGKNNPNNKLLAFFNAGDGSWSNSAPEWFVYPSSVTTDTIGALIGQEINADTYVVSLDAAFWAL